MKTVKSQKERIEQFRQNGLKPIGSKSGVVYLKNKESIVLCHPDGECEGFFDKNYSLDESRFPFRSQIMALFLIGLSFTYFTTDVTIVDGHSMEPTLKNHTILLSSKIWNNLEKRLGKNMIVKFHDQENTRSIKRIIAVPGDEIEFDYMTVKVNGEVADYENISYPPKYAEKSSEESDFQKKKHNPPISPKYKLKLKSHQYFVMGDNRSNSSDSRTYGPISDGQILSIVRK